MSPKSMFIVGAVLYGLNVFSFAAGVALGVTRALAAVPCAGCAFGWLFLALVACLSCHYLHEPVVWAWRQWRNVEKAA